MKKIFPLLIVLLLFSSLVIAETTPNLPYTLSGDVKLESGECLTGFDIKLNSIVNPWIGEKKEVLIPVNEFCEYNFVLGNEPFTQWGNGMNLNLIFCNKEINPSCEVTLTIGKNCPSSGGCPYDFIYKSSDKVIIQDREVIVTEQIKEEKYICSDGTKVDNPNDCPEGTDEWWKYILIALSAVGITAGFLALIKYWKKKDPKRAVKMAKTYLKNKK